MNIESRSNFCISYKPDTSGCTWRKSITSGTNNALPTLAQILVPEGVTLCATGQFLPEQIVRIQKTCSKYQKPEPIPEIGLTYL